MKRNGVTYHKYLVTYSETGYEEKHVWSHGRHGGLGTWKRVPTRVRREKEVWAVSPMMAKRAIKPVFTTKKALGRRFISVKRID